MNGEAYYVDIIEYETEETVKSLGPYPTDRMAEKADRGLGYQLDHSRFYSQLRKDAR